LLAIEANEEAESTGVEARHGHLRGGPHDAREAQRVAIPRLRVQLDVPYRHLVGRTGLVFLDGRFSQELRDDARGVASGSRIGALRVKMGDELDNGTGDRVGKRRVSKKRRQARSLCEMPSDGEGTDTGVAVRGDLVGLAVELLGGHR
jgi:hypothetical protein